MLGMVEQGAGQRSAAFEEAAPYLPSSVSVSDVWAETGLWAGKKWNIGRVWYGGKKKKKGVLLCSLRGGLCLPGQVRGCHRSLCFRGSEWGLGAEMSVVLYSQTGTWPLAGRVTAG